MDVIVIGGGASGMAAALTAARGGHAVTLLEKQDRVGRKLLATGNGRCNLTNMDLSVDNYHGEAPDFAAPALRALDPAATRAFFRELGLLTVAEPSGKVYPVSDQAGSALDVLRFALEGAGVTTVTDCALESLGKKGARFALRTSQGPMTADKVILCCGGLAAGKLGGSKSGYDLLQSLGHSCTKLYPALVQLRTDPTWVRSLKGVRAQADLVLSRGREVLARNAGEVQFTDYGVSGPAVFEISRHAAAGGAGLSLALDLLPGVAFSELEQLLWARCASLPQLPLNDLLTGTVHNRLGRTLLRYAGFELNAPASSLRAPDRKKIAGAVKAFVLPVTGTQGFDAAQVTAGGIRTREFRPDTLESRLVPGLYAAGEVLDIDGDCGGYNLQWAWSSGVLAGRLKEA